MKKVDELEQNKTQIIKMRESGMLYREIAKLYDTSVCMIRRKYVEWVGDTPKSEYNELLRRGILFDDAKAYYHKKYSVGDVIRLDGVRHKITEKHEWFFNLDKHNSITIAELLERDGINKFLEKQKKVTA